MKITEDFEIHTSLSVKGGFAYLCATPKLISKSISTENWKEAYTKAWETAVKYGVIKNGQVTGVYYAMKNLLQ